MTAAAREGILAELLAPVGVERFVRDSLGREPLLVRGDARRVEGLLSLDRVASGVLGRERERGRFLVNAGDLDSEAGVRAYLDAGQPIVWNSAFGATPALDALVTELADVLGAHVWANVYATGSAVKPFDAHFDAHEVLAVQCEGAKEWMVSRVRVNCPIDRPELAPTVRRALAERRAEAIAEPLMTVVTEPGDVLYIPRGQFHDARTPGPGRSLHVTLAVEPPTGIDALEALVPLGLREALFREYFPPPLADEDDARARAQLDRLAERVAALLRGDEVLGALRALGAIRTGGPGAGDADRRS